MRERNSQGSDLRILDTTQSYMPKKINKYRGRQIEGKLNNSICQNSLNLFPVNKIKNM